MMKAPGIEIVFSSLLPFRGKKGEPKKKNVPGKKVGVPEKF
jgi:hypothetical protein